MSNGAMDLRVAEERTEGGTRRLIHLDNVRDPRHRSLTIFFDMAGEYRAPPLDLLDGFVFGIIFYAMRLGQGIRVHGRMSCDALRNLNEFQDAWILWNGSRYSKVDIIARDTIDGIHIPKSAEAIVAFSGGVDSIFTLLRHATGVLDLASYPVGRSVLLVHGFDVSLEKPEQLEALKERTAPFLKELNLEVRTIRTNLKTLALQDWEDSHAAQLACCLHNYSHEFGYGLIGSTEPYDALVLPWGSNPATDHLLSSAAFRIVHDGAAYSRTRKVEEIARHAAAMAAVKVCWEGADAAVNCGVCEKCIRTQLNFLAVGVVNPPCFAAPSNVQQHIDGMPLLNHTSRAELRSIIAYAKSKGISDMWVKQLEQRLARYRPPGESGRYKARVLAAWDMIQAAKWKELTRTLTAMMTHGR